MACNLAILLTWTLALAAPASVPDDCGKCTLESGYVSLCPSHDKSDRAALKRLKKKTRSKESEERKEALQALATLSSGHANAPSVEASQWIAEYLEDEEAALRVQAVAALLEGQHPEVVVGALTAEVPIIGRDWKVADKYLRVWIEARNKKQLQFTPKEQAEFNRQVRVLQYGDPLLQALGKLPDDRCTAALVGVLGWPVETTPVTFFRSASLSALELDTLAAVTAIIALLERLDEYLVQGSIPDPYPRPLDLRLSDALLLEIVRPPNATDYLLLTRALRSVAQSKGLTGCPTEGQGPAGPWKAWLAGNEVAFKTELGTLQRPVQATLKTD